MKKKRPILFSLLGSIFLAIGLTTLLGIAASQHFTGSTNWIFYAYALINFLVGYGFFTMQSWLLPAITINCIVQASLVVTKFYMVSSVFNISAVFSLILNLAILVAVYLHREKLTSRYPSVYAGGVFMVLWAVIVCYNSLTVLS